MHSKGWVAWSTKQSVCSLKKQTVSFGLPVDRIRAWFPLNARNQASESTWFEPTLAITEEAN